MSFELLFITRQSVHKFMYLI